MPQRAENPGCLGVILRLLGGEKAAAQEFPYRLRDDFMSPAEASFYRSLMNAVAGELLVFAKVRLGDVLFVGKGEGRPGASNRINMKHVDFVLCDPKTLKLRAAVELDDKSHARTDRVERDAFLEKACAAAGLPLLRVRVQAGYDAAKIRAELTALLTGVAPVAVENSPPPVGGVAVEAPESAPSVPICPKCNVPMVLRTRRQGSAGTVGEQFWGCENYPRCREVRAV